MMKIPTLVLLLIGMSVSATGRDPVRPRHQLGLFRDVMADTVTSRAGETIVPPGPLLFELDPYFPEHTGDSRCLIAFDCDGDGDQDLLIGNSPAQPQPSALFLNDGNGRFRIAEDSGLPPYIINAARADLDNDGIEDVAMVAYDRMESFAPRASNISMAILPDSLFAVPEFVVARFDSTGHASLRRFGPEVLPPGRRIRQIQIAAADVDRDGDIDLALAFGLGTEHGIVVLDNTRAGFDVVQRVEFEHPDLKDLSPFALAVHDTDGDGDQDLIVSTGAGLFTLRSEMLVFGNDDGRFVPIPSLPMPKHPRSAGIGWIDADVDGDLDFFACQHDAQGGRNRIYYQGVDGSYMDVGPEAGLWAGYTSTVGFAWGDLDNDGDPDAVPSRYEAFGAAARIPIHINDGNGRFGTTFAPFEPPLVAPVSAAVACDVDGDLDLDLVVAATRMYADIVTAEQSRARLYVNRSESAGALELRLEGTLSNHSAIGAVVELNRGGRWSMMTVGDGAVAGTHIPPLPIHVGLGHLEQLDAAVVRWPSGLVESWEGLAAGRRWTLREGSGDPFRAQ